ncbi:MAG: chromophore lyase CpcT/CpeT [Xanthomonadales bacterium]|nr:Chromophore lyase CpcT/CpeT [Xanthomonadales bacterium]MCC6592859.1 chromophore lyase CpcT/CpeT [Xanthomonadales bacterium]
MRRIAWSVCVLLAACVAQPTREDYAQEQIPASAPAPLDLDANLARLSEWFAGEWDNHEQVIQEQESGVSPGARHERVHALFLPVAVPAIGGSVFFARQTLDDDPARVFRLRLYRFAVDRAADAIRLDQYSFVDEARWRDAHRDPSELQALTTAELRYAPDCAVYFRFEAASAEFVGSTREHACKVASARRGAVIVEDRIRLGADTLAILSRAHDETGRLVYGNADSVPHLQRRVRWFRGFLAINRVGPGARPEDRDFRTWNGIVLHSEGRRQPIEWEDGRRSGWSVQLARLSVRGDSVLALNLLDDATGRTLAYAWAAPESSRIGLNLRWFQADFSQVADAGRFEPAVPR